MSLIATTPYLSDIYSVRQYGAFVQRLSYHRSMRQSGWELVNPVKKGSVNSTKLDNNLCRAKSKILELALCNDWQYFVTCTFSPDKIDRYDYPSVQSAIANFFHDFNRRRPPECKVKYSLVPEFHKDGAIHFHGLLSGLTPDDLCINVNGYLDWDAYKNRCGFISLSVVKDPVKVAYYMTKYITKELSKSPALLGQHLFFCSKGLKRSKLLYQGVGPFINVDWDYVHPEGYYKCKTIDTRSQSLLQYIEK